MRVPINIYLALNAILFFGAGLYMYLVPKKVLKIWVENGKPISGEALSVLAGWGSACLALGVNSAFLSRTNTFVSKRITAMAHFVLWLSLSYGTYKMNENKYFGEWRPSILQYQFYTCITLTVLSFYYGFIFRERSIVTEDARSKLK